MTTPNSGAAALGGAPAAPAGTPPAAGSTPPASGTPPAGGTPPAAGNQPWYSGHPDEGVRNWAANKGWQDPMAALESSYNLEKLIGFEKAGRTLVMPKDDATPEERAAFFQKLGAPEKADGYKLPEALAQDPVAQKFRDIAHKAGMLPQQFEQSLAFVTAEAQALKQQQDQQRSVQSEQDMTAIRGEWGAAYDQNMELAKRAAAQFIPAKDTAERQAVLEKIEDALGTANFLKFFAKVGEGLGEHKVHSNGDPGHMGKLTPAAAKARIEALKGDKEWSAAYLSGDANKKAEMQRLIEQAYPQGAAA